jgi:hypothetical protein
MILSDVIKKLQDMEKLYGGDIDVWLETNINDNCKLYELTYIDYDMFERYEKTIIISSIREITD